MTRIQLDAAAANLVREVEGEVMFLDEHGHPLRVFVARTYPGEPVYSKEEWQRRISQPGGMTTAEVVEHLKKLGSS